MKNENMQKSGKLTQEEIDATVYRYLSKGWSPVGCPEGLGFISPCGNWINFIDTTSGEKWYLNRRNAERAGFYVALSEQNTPSMAIAE